MALIANNISGSISNFSKIGITGSVVFANRPNSSFPTLPTDTTFYVSGSKGLTSNRAVFHGDVVLSGTTYVGTSENGGSLGVIGHGGIIMNPYGTGAGQTSEIRFKELAANGGNYVALKAPSSIAANVSFVLPSSDGSANHVIKTDGAGNLSFAAATTLVTPGGSDTQVQFNDGGSTFGGDAGLTYNKTTDALTIAGDLIVNGGDVITTNAASTVNLFNTNATTLNLAGAATTVEIGAATGTTFVNNSLTVDGKLTVTGGTTAVTDAVLGNAAVGSFPFYDGGAGAGVYAMFGHKDLDHSTAITNYALYQDNVGNTVVNASNDKTLFLSVNNTAMGFITNNLLGTGIDAISLTGQSSTKTNMALGNDTSDSSTTIYAGTGGMLLTGAIGTAYTIGGQGGTGTITVGRSIDNNTVNIATGTTAAGKTQTINVGNNTGTTGNTIISIASSSLGTKKVYIGRNGGIGYFFGSGTGSEVYVNGNIIKIGDNVGSWPAAITLSGSINCIGLTTTESDLFAGSAELGSFPAWTPDPSAFAMFGHKTLSHSSIGNYALLQSSAGSTGVNAASGQTLYLRNNNTDLASLTSGITSITGASNVATTTTIGNTASTSTTSIYAGSGGITLSGSGGSTVITGSSTTYTDATVGAWEIGSLPATQTAFPNAYAFIGHKDLNHSVDGNYALVQSNVGDTFLGAVSTKDIFFKNGTDIVGTLSNDTVSFTGKTTTATTTTIGNTTGASSTTIQAGTGDIVMAATVRNSSQPSFLATLNAAQNNFATSTNVTVLFNSEIYDNANNFDVVSYTFTAPETGKYLFSVAIRLDNVDTAADYYTLYLITSNRDYRLSLIDPGNFAADPVYWYLNGSAIADMDATDTAYVVIRQQVGTSQTDILNGTANSFFSGWFLG